MDELYLVLCSNDNTDEQRAFVSFRRSDADAIKACFLRFVTDPQDWKVVVIRSVEE